MKLLLFRREAPLPRGALAAFAHLAGGDAAAPATADDEDSDFEVPFAEPGDAMATMR